MDLGVSGQLADNHPHVIDSCRNNEASAEIAFGYAVCWDTEDQDVLLPAAETDLVRGIFLHSHSYQVGEQLGDDGILPGEMMNVLRKGRVLVTAEDSVAPGDRLWVRCTTGGAGEIIGGLTNADEGTETIDCTKQGQWLTTAAAGGLAWLEVDFTAKP
jgi:hypothetical protein